MCAERRTSAAGQRRHDSPPWGWSRWNTTPPHRRPARDRIPAGLDPPSPCTCPRPYRKHLPADKLSTWMSRWYATALYRSIVAVSEHHGGQVGNGWSRHVVATATGHSHSRTGVGMFRLIALASKWVRQSWRTDRLMENGVGEVSEVPDALVGVRVPRPGERRCGVRASTRGCHVSEVRAHPAGRAEAGMKPSDRQRAAGRIANDSMA
jgi:hypothetical protein